jgi:NodT family efflux transporter outer membrane factor (OMF) lipoprotein
MKKITLLIFLAGCAVGPDYQSIVGVPAEESWVEPCETQLEICCQEPEVDWWKHFSDPQLSEYIERASCYNNNLQVAEWNIIVSRALKREEVAHFFPQINGDLNATRYGYSKTGPFVYFQETQGFGPLIPKIQVPFYQTLFNTLFDATWEIDLFGKNARAVESAERALESSIENRNDILVSLLAETAKNYIEVRGAQEQLRLLYENISYVEKSLSLTQNRYKKGLDNELDVLRSQAILENLHSNVANYQAQMYAGIFSLSILTGQDPEALLCEMLPFKPLPQLPSEVCVGLKSDLLLRRPDVRKAERNLAQSVAQIGMAKAAFFPSFSLTGSGGLQSLELRRLFQAQSFQWSYGVDFNFPVFQGGYLMAQYQGAKANAEALYFQYQETVLEALKDAETSLVTYATDLESIDYLRSSVENYRKVRNLSLTRFNQGLTNKMDFLDRENDLINAEQALASKQTQSLIDLIALYKSLGGGWQCASP